jgi:tetratricopeptide (TPR) repeat protein
VCLGDLAQARRSVSPDSKNNKDDIAQAYTHYAVGILYDNNDNIRRAVEEYKKAVEHDRSSSAINMRLSFGYIKLGQNAINQLNAAIKSCGKDISSFALFNMGILYPRLGNFTASEHCLNAAIIQLEREYKATGMWAEEAHMAHFYLATFYERMGRRDDAKRHLRRAIYLYPDNSEALNYLGYMYAEENEKLDYAIFLIKKALGFEPDNGAYLDSLGWAYFKKGRLREALDNLKKAQDLMPDPVISEHLEKVKERMKGR